SADDDSAGRPETVVLTYGYWRSRFGGDPSVVGKPLLVDGRPHEIIGVLPEAFRFMDAKPSLVLPLQLDRSKTFLGNFSYTSLARLKPGVTLAQANADAARLVPVAIHRFPPFPGFNEKMFEDARLAPALQPLKQSLVGDISSMLWILTGTIGLVLLIA